jgi:hypothetical protein
MGQRSISQVLIRTMDAREPALTDGVSNNADGATAAADPYSHRREAWTATVLHTWRRIDPDG